MKTALLALLIFGLNAHAHAQDSFEDTPENLAKQVETNRSAPFTKARQGTWVYAFELVHPDGSVTVLSEQNRNIKVKPASTMKIFTGWFAFKNAYGTDAILGKMLKESSNAVADKALKDLGGKAALKNFFLSEGLPLTPKDFIQADGSGLSYENKTNCEVQMELLKTIQRDPNFEAFKNLMAQPGETGTLKDRLPSLKGKVFAKTGTLKRTAALSGFVDTEAGTLVFCILSDYLPAASRTYRPRIDAMVINAVKSVFPFKRD